MLYGILEISIDLFGCQCAGGDERIRTADPLLAKQVLSQLSYIPWEHAMRAISDARTDRDHLPPHATCRIAGGPSDLESLKSGKDRTNPGVHSTIKRTNADLHRELSRLPNYFRNSISHFRDDYSSAFARATCLIFADLITFVTAGL